MRFEPADLPAPQPDEPVAPSPSTPRFTLEQGECAGQTYTVMFELCPNPCCSCAVITLVCTPESAPNKSLRFHLHVREHRLDRTLDTGPDAAALGRAFVAEAQANHWTWLDRFFLAEKRRQLASVDLDTVQVDFPVESARDGLMVGYYEIFPWAEPLELSREGEDWLVDDQYCVRPGCHCTEVLVQFFKVDALETPERGPLRSSCGIHFDYTTVRTSGYELGSACPSPKSLLDFMMSTHPDLARTFAHRHQQLRRLGRRFMTKTRTARPANSTYDPSDAPTPRVSAPKPGRNDPCPCGSGMKFKKCCGR